MKSAITAIGIANPRYCRAQSETAEIVAAGLKLKLAEKRLLKSVYKATGILQRHSVLSDYCKFPGEFEFFPNDPAEPFPTTAMRMKIYKENALQLSLEAIHNCLTANVKNKNEITHVITVSCTGLYAPGIDIEIVQQLKLNPSIKRTAINFMGCYGAFNGIKVADDICRAQTNAKVLLVCVELCTIHFQKNWTMDNIISNAIFGDGAAAIMIESASEHQKSLRIESFYCDILPQTSNEMAWHVADFGFDIVLSTYVPEVIEKGIATFTEKLLHQSGHAFADIDFYAIHPGGVKILQACEKALQISKEDNRYAYHVLEQYGNMSSPTILFVLKKIWDDLKTHDHHKNIFSCAFGPGLTLESMMLKVQW